MLSFKPEREFSTAVAPIQWNAKKTILLGVHHLAEGAESLPNGQFHGFSQCPPVTVNPARRKSSAKSFCIATAASNGMGFR